MIDALRAWIKRTLIQIESDPLCPHCRRPSKLYVRGGVCLHCGLDPVSGKPRIDWAKVVMELTCSWCQAYIGLDHDDCPECGHQGRKAKILCGCEYCQAMFDLFRILSTGRDD